MKKAEMTAAKKRSRLGAYNRKDIIFYAALMAFPVVQFLIFYIVVNANSLLLTFRSYDTLTGEVSWVGWDNLAEAFRMMTQQKELLDAMGTSFLAYAISLCIGTPLALLFSFYIYKEYPASGVFRVLLFLPSIVSAIVIGDKTKTLACVKPLYCTLVHVNRYLLIRFISLLCLKRTHIFL